MSFKDLQNGKELAPVCFWVWSWIPQHNWQNISEITHRCVGTGAILGFSLFCHYKLLSEEVTAAAGRMPPSMESTQKCDLQATVSAFCFQVKNGDSWELCSVVTRMLPELFVSAFLKSRSMCCNITNGKESQSVKISWSLDGQVFFWRIMWFSQNILCWFWSIEPIASTF